MTAEIVLLVACAAVPIRSAAPATPAAARFSVVEARITDIQEAIQSGRITAEQVVRMYLARIKAYNRTCVRQPQGILGPVTPVANAGQINALSTLNLRPAARRALGFDERKTRTMSNSVDADLSMPDALETAVAQDRELARTQRLVGPLHGVVIAVKDQFDTFDMRTTSGADADYANDRPPDDATFITRLRAAGAIILAKSNLGEYASAIPRSSFGGTFCNPYDTERSPGGSSSGSASAVAANLVTCAIGEETGSSIRGPASANNVVGLAPTQELVSRDGMMGAGIHTRVGPVCRTVEDAARILDVIAGYDPKDELTVFSIGRMPSQPYQNFAHSSRLDGVRIGVVREYMDKDAFSVADAQTIDIVDRAIEDLRKAGATIVEPAPGHSLFGDCIARYTPEWLNGWYAQRFPQLFVTGPARPQAVDSITILVDIAANPSLMPALTLRDFGPPEAPGESRYMMNRYLRERGDARIRSSTDLIYKANFHQDPQFPDRRAQRQEADRDRELDMSGRMVQRFALQQMILQCIAQQRLDALVSPTSNLPPAKIGAPGEPQINGRSGVWTFFGHEGFPVMTVPAGFTTLVYDRVRDPAAALSPEPPQGMRGGEQVPGDDRTRLVGPISAQLPVGMDLIARPFDEPLLFRIASAYTAATQHRRPPPVFGPLPGQK